MSISKALRFEVLRRDDGFAGCCWRQLTTMQERAAQIISEGGQDE